MKDETVNMKEAMKIKTIIFVLPPLALLLVACHNAPANTQQTDVADTVAADTVVAQSATQQTNPLTFSCRGTIVTENQVEVRSRISEQIVMLGAEMGQHVTKGQVLVRLDRTAIEDNIQKARAELEQAEDRYQAILMGQGYKHDALDQAPERLRQRARIRSGYNTTQAELRQLEHQLSYCTILSPVTGVVSERQAERYSMAVTGETLYRIIDTEHLKVVFYVLENELSKFAVGTTVSVFSVSYPDERHDVRITAVSPHVEENSMVLIEARLPYHPHLLPGMTVVVTL